MKKTALIVIITVAFFFVVGWQWTDTLDLGKAAKWLPNAYNAVSMPSWQWLQQGSTKAVHWEDYQSCPRFAIHDPLGTPEDPLDDVVLDKETGLVWTRNADLFGKQQWIDAMTAAHSTKIGGKYGWRLPTLEEIYSVVDAAQRPCFIE